MEKSEEFLDFDKMKKRIETHDAIDQKMKDVIRAMTILVKEVEGDNDDFFATRPKAEATLLAGLNKATYELQKMRLKFYNDCFGWNEED